MPVEPLAAFTPSSCPIQGPCTPRRSGMHAGLQDICSMMHLALSAVTIFLHVMHCKPF